ncbi:HAMP domain-containing protein [Patescibacteria group bacterium]|nr:HAMP domain-containing protein [Patescibacteria group bacterium]
MKNNLQTKVMVLFLLLALIPLGAVGLFSIKTAEDLIVEMVNSQLQNVADDKVHLLERWLSERRADLLVIAGSSILGSMDPDRIGPYLNLVGLHYKVYKDISVISPEGSIVFGITGKNSGAEWKDRLEAPANKLFLSGITLRPEDRESTFRIAAPIFDSDGVVKGTVCATVGTSTILNIILNVNLGKTGECYLVDKDGTFLAHKEPRRILAENIAQSGSFKNIFVTKARQKTYLDYRGIEVLGTSRKVPGTDWYLVVEQDRDEAFKSADLLKRYVCIAMAFSICCAVFLAWSIAYYLVHPIGKLSKAAKNLASGEFDKASVHTKRKDEIGLLYQAFNDMAIQLKERQRFLEKEVGLKESELHETDIMLQQSRLAAAMSEKFAALGRLGAGVTHEIRTPITSIKLFLESVQSEIEISHEYEEDLMVAMQQIKRIETTINRFLDFAKPQGLVFSPIDVQQVISDILSVVRPMANKQECSVTVKTPGDLKKIKGDKKLLEETLINLLINSMEAMDHGGKLEVTTAMDQREMNGKSVSCVRVDVSDTGQGIAEENIPNIFDPFFTTKSAGTGLGLSLVHSAVQRHGGTICVKSNAGGTVFSIFLPAEPCQDVS